MESKLNSHQTSRLESLGIDGPFTCIGEGFRAKIFESISRVIIRIGRHQNDGNSFTTESELINALQKYVDAAMPQVSFVSNYMAEFPHGIMIYQKIPGKRPSLPSQALAESAAKVLLQIHGMTAKNVFPTHHLNADGISELTLLAKFHLCDRDKRITNRWMTEMKRFLEGDRVNCVIHGDFWHANWLVPGDEKSITGLLDFERCGVGSFHQDLAPLRYFGDDFRLAVLTAYCAKVDIEPDSLLAEVRMFDILREMKGLAWALTNPEANELDESVEKVTDVLATYD